MTTTTGGYTVRLPGPFCTWYEGTDLHQGRGTVTEAQAKWRTAYAEADVRRYGTNGFARTVAADDTDVIVVLCGLFADFAKSCPAHAGGTDGDRRARAELNRRLEHLDAQRSAPPEAEQPQGDPALLCPDCKTRWDSHDELDQHRMDADHWTFEEETPWTTS
ncbi:hypothetical protein [Streptacidiphilus cavernicola]|uniref:C2H2-type domain-containing protein n=1 Tax=Streptacidiphilus cavernicola TaxID=3342716 RepID=A0ABV6VYI3_9ACTN